MSHHLLVAAVLLTACFILAVDAKASGSSSRKRKGNEVSPSREESTPKADFKLLIPKEEPVEYDAKFQSGYIPPTAEENIARYKTFLDLNSIPENLDDLKPETDTAEKTYPEQKEKPTMREKFDLKMEKQKRIRQNKY